MGSIHSGGIRCIVELLNGLIDRGYDASCFVQMGPYESTWLPSKFPVIPREELHKFDGVLISPYTPTAREVANARNAARRMYWVHTHEPSFVHNPPAWRNESHQTYMMDELEYFATSHYVSIILDLIYGRKVHTTLVPPGVDHKLFKHSEWNTRNKNKFVIGMLQRPEWVRGLEVGFAAVERLQDKYPGKIELFKFGGIPQDQMWEAYGRCHIFLDPSRLAGFPMPPLEAMACGTIPLVTHFGPDYLHDGSNGFFIPKDDVDGVYAKLVEVYEQWDALGEISQRAYEQSLNWTWDNTVDSFLKVAGH